MERSYTFTEQRSSSVLVAAGAEAQLPEVVASLKPDGLFVVYDEAVVAAADRIQATLSPRHTVAVPGGDSAKRLEIVGNLAEHLHRAGATRASVLLAIGGGAITDLCGFAASIFLRGIPFVSCPTTTLAMCDAALGGKNGIDHCGLKNRLGTIRQPDAIVMDTNWLATLPEDMYREGLVEVVKKAAVLDSERFAELEALAPKLMKRDAEATRRTIEMAIEMKMAVVVDDQREGDRRRALNAGHTIGHAIESSAAGSLRHGHAVAMGLLAECRAASVDTEIAERIGALLAAIGVATDIPENLRNGAELWQLAQRDKKAMRGSVPMFVPRRLGEGEIAELTEPMLHRAVS
ncbi:MAG: 3-dehydroquinate synthase family protein [Planctomycetota bacterium]